MSTENVSLKKIDLGDYVFLARPCVAVSEEVVKHLAERARQEKLEFIGVFDDRMDDSVQREVVMSLASSPEISIAIRHVCAGLYSRSFLDTYCDGVEAHQQGLFPDLYILWMAFVHADRAMFAACDICDRVEIDTVWIDDVDAAYTVNITYDRIKDHLMQDWSVWEKWKGYYTLQRWRCYYEMLHWMTEDAGWQFAERMAVDFHRSMELDELDQELFSQEEKTGLYVLAKDPGFLKRYYLGKVVYSKKIFDLNNELGRRAEELDESHREADGLRRDMEAQRIKYETSTTFRVGKAVMFVPVTLKKAVKKLLHRN